MAKRRDRGEGSVYINPKTGLWCGSVRGFPAPPTRRYIYGHSPTEVKTKLRGLRKERDAAMANGGEGSNQHLRNYLPEWLAALKESGSKPSTLKSYGDAVRTWLIPHVGDLELGKINGYDGHRLMDRLKDGGASNYGRGRALKILRMALGYAVHLRAIPSNPLVGIKPPKHVPREATWWTPDEANAFLKATIGDSLHALYVLAVDTGCRLGELLALHRYQVDLGAKSIHIDATLEADPRGPDARHSPKTERSVRTVPLTPRAVAALRAQLERSMALGCPWVFPSAEGTGMWQSNAGRSFRAAVRRAGVPRIRFHDKRHTHASILVRAGVEHAEGAARLGHTVAMFQNTYVHVNQDRAQAVADKFTAIMGAE